MHFRLFLLLLFFFSTSEFSSFSFHFNSHTVQSIILSLEFCGFQRMSIALLPWRHKTLYYPQIPTLHFGLSPLSPQSLETFGLSSLIILPFPECLLKEIIQKTALQTWLLSPAYSTCDPSMWLYQSSTPLYCYMVIYPTFTAELCLFTCWMTLAPFQFFNVY